LDRLASADTIVVPGRHNILAPAPEAVVDALRAAFDRGTRIASICVGAFTLAAAGLLDGRRATTHWRAASAFREAFPAVRLEPDALFVDEGQILTSAGASAGLDLCLHLVQRDYGAAVAADAAREAVAPLYRSGGQAQFILRNQGFVGTDLDEVLAWIEANASRPLTLRDLAEHAMMSLRTLNRRFRAETGQTPMEWLIGVRIRHAQELLEATPESVENIAQRVGFTSSTNFREQFRRIAGVTPSSYRSTFRGRLSA
jgi:transcriptional regulator GlxA family with amidase domain